MLKKLTIKNFAIIDEQTIELSEGLNVLTGETGAGKSILIEALGFLLGARASSSWLRTGAAKLEVTGWFDDLVIRRELDASGKTRVFINSQSSTLSALSALSDKLIDFHGQHEHQTLLKPAVQLDLLDRFGGHDVASVEAAFAEWDRVRLELESTQMSDEERRRRVETLRFQVQELKEAALKEGEEQELESALPRLKNAERLKSFAGAAYDALYDQEGAALGALQKVERGLAELARIDASIQPLHDKIEEARLSLDEAAHELGAYRDKLDIDPKELDAIMGRQDALSRLKKKYGPTVEEMIAFRDKAAAELQRLENSAESAAGLEKKLDQAAKRYAEAAEALNASRRKAAKKFETLLLKELRMLGMPNAQFSVAVEMEEGRFAKTGCDCVEFLMAPNPGEPLKPVKAIASGGELSRVMLALKTVFAKADRVAILVFDEVDAGIGGAVGRSVGEKLHALGRTHQVLCVTHLPQVACFGRAHFAIAKQVVAGRTKVAVERLDGARRLEAIALMLGGREATAASRKHAQELLEASAA